MPRQRRKSTAQPSKDLLTVLGYSARRLQIRKHAADSRRGALLGFEDDGVPGAELEDIVAAGIDLDRFRAIAHRHAIAGFIGLGTRGKAVALPSPPEPPESSTSEAAPEAASTEVVCESSSPEAATTEAVRESSITETASPGAVEESAAPTALSETADTFGSQRTCLLLTVRPVGVATRCVPTAGVVLLPAVAGVAVDVSVGTRVQIVAHPSRVDRVALACARVVEGRLMGARGLAATRRRPCLS
jgi:hypothetical protein